jgi:hypothetical protein
VPITLKTKTVFHCKCVRCNYEWDADTKPKRCARCKIHTWNGEDHRFADPFYGVPLGSQIANGTEAPRLPGYLPLLETLVAAREVVAKVIEDISQHEEHFWLSHEKEVLANLDQRIEQLNVLRPLRSTYMKRRKKKKQLPEQAVETLGYFT